MIRRGLLALSVSIVALSALAPVASADSDVLLVVGDASPIRIDGARIINEGDVGSGAATFTMRNQDGSPGRATEPGASITALLGFVGMSPLSLVDSADAVRVSFGSSKPGYYVSLSKSEVIDGFPDDPLGGRRDAVVSLSYDSDAIHFLRPIRNDTDVNATDHFNLPRHEDLTIRIATTGPPLHVDASASPLKIEPGASVQFHAQIQEHEPGVTYRYTWDFDDGSPQVTDPNPQHTYSGDRTAQPKVTVIGVQDGSSGTGSVGTIQVGQPSTGTPTPTATATASATAAPDTTGGGGGGVPGAGGGGRSGGGEGGKKDRATGPSRSKGKDNTRKRGSKQGSATATPAPTPAGTAAATATAAPTVSAKATATATPTPASNDPAANPGSPDQSEEPPLANETPTTSPPGGEHVAGILLASSGSLADVIDAAKSAEKQQEQDRSQARHGGGGNATVAGWVGGGSGLVALLALGAVLEGGIPRRRPSLR